MKGTAILTLLGAILVLVLFSCVARPSRVGKGFWSKSYHILLLGLYKLDLALAHGMRYIHLAMEHIFKGYKYSAVKAERLRVKEQRLTDYRQQMRESSDGYKKKEKYNRKILE